MSYSQSEADLTRENAKLREQVETLWRALKSANRDADEADARAAELKPDAVRLWFIARTRAEVRYDENSSTPWSVIPLGGVGICARTLAEAVDLSMENEHNQTRTA